jgi:predicted small lipoprotein YifL
MKGRVLIGAFLLMSLLMVLLGCGRKGPPTLPKKPSSLIRIEQKAQLPGCHLGNSFLSSLRSLGLLR